jgi:wobble nucleotide-excising tRNase
MSDQDASSSADIEIDENTLTNIPINFDDKDFIKKITKSQLVEIIKNLSKEIESLKVKPLPTVVTKEDKQPNLLSLQILPSLPIYLNR